MAEATGILLTLAGVLYVVILVTRSRLASKYADLVQGVPTSLLPPDTLTVAQPILSGDPSLESRLRTNLKNLPDQQFIWLIEEDDTVAASICQSLQKDRVRILPCPPCPDDCNPKVWKLQRSIDSLATPYFAVLDDDTVLPPKSAAQLVAASDEATVATGLPCYQATKGVPSTLLAQFVNNNSVFTYLGTACLGPPITLNGMGYVFRRENLALIENFEPILHELTDDLALATLIRDRNGTIHQSRAPLPVRTTVKGGKHYFALMHRWYLFSLLLVKRQSFSLRLEIFALHGLHPFLLLASLVSAAIPAFFPGSVITLAVLLVARGFILVKTQKRFFGKSLHQPVGSVVSELLQPFHLLHAIFQRTITWRTKNYRVRDTSDFTAV